MFLQGVVHWSRGVTVSTLDPESSDRGSNPREASCAAPAHLQSQNYKLHCKLERMKHRQGRSYIPLVQSFFQQITYCGLVV